MMNSYFLENHFQLYLLYNLNKIIDIYLHVKYIYILNTITRFILQCHIE